MSDLDRKFLGKYRLLAPIGEGGMAEVYKAHHPGLDRHVAIKVLRALQEERKDLIARFEREARAVARLRHPHIVQIYDFDKLESLYYLVMEFIDGPTLEHELQRRLANDQFFTLSEINEIFGQLSDAVGYAHNQGIIHRDIKPSNVMFRSDGQVVLTDFGLAHLVDVTNYTKSGAVIGTFKYMSPEQCQGHSIDTRSDIYSLGIILYEMMTGRTPFVADHPAGLLYKHVHEPPSLLTKFKPQIPRNVERVVLKSLNKSPQNRYQTVEEMAHALQNAIKERETDDNLSQEEMFPDQPVSVEDSDSPSLSSHPFSSSARILPAKEAGISSQLLSDLRQVLLDCGPFATLQKLDAVFADSRLSPWRGRLPHANSPVGRVKNSIGFLHKRYNEAGKNALVLFLRVLQDETSQQDKCWQRLGKLADQLEQELESSFVAENKVSVVVYDKPGVFEKPSQLFGREELLNEVQSLLDMQQHLLLHGLGGCGKTALAATLADTLLQGGDRSVIWVQTGNEDADAIIDALADQLANSQEKQDIRLAVGKNKLKRVRDMLERHQASLLVLDDVWDENALQVLEAIPRNMAVIVTSRRRFVLPHIIDVGDLSPDAALDLLDYHAGLFHNLQYDQYARQLCETLGYHAYALEIAGNILKVDNRTPRRLLSLMDEPHKTMMPAGGGEAGRESVGALLERSFHSLQQSEQTAFLAFGELFAPGATPALLNQYVPAEVEDMDQALNALVRRGLAKRRIYWDGEIEYYYVHDLTFYYARAKVKLVKGGHDETRITAVQQYLIKHAQDFDRLVLDMANILGAAKAAARSNPENLVQMMSWLCVGGYPRPQSPSYLDVRGHTLPLLRQLDEAIEVAEQMGLEEALHYLWGKRGNAYHDRGNLIKCRDAYEEALALAPNSHRRIVLLALVGKVSGELKDTENATDLLQEAHDLAQERGNDGALSYVLEIQSFLAAQQKDFEAARRFAAEYGEIARRQGDKEMLGFSLLNLGSAERELGNADEALSIHQEALAIVREEGLLVIEAYVLQAMGEDYYHLDQLDDAVSHFNDAIKMHTRTGGTDNVAYIQQFCQEKGINLKEG